MEKDYRKAWRLRNKEKVRAHWMVSNAIRYGKLKRLPCEKCGNEKSHAHHPDYSKPLEINWLCHKCHWAEHGWFKKEKGQGRKVRSDAKRPKLVDKAQVLRNKGHSYTEIAAKLKCSKGTVYKWLNKTSYN